MLPSEAEEAGLWNAIAEAPEDEVPRLIFADWLEERNDPRGPLLRDRRYWRHLNADCRDPVQVVLGALDACPPSSVCFSSQVAGRQTQVPRLASCGRRCQPRRGGRSAP